MTPGTLYKAHNFSIFYYLLLGETELTPDIYRITRFNGFKDSFVFIDYIELNSVLITDIFTIK